jgi:hypothetical protein
VRPRLRALWPEPAFDEPNAPPLPLPLPGAT